MHMLTVADQSSLTYQVNPEMKVKYGIEKQTESFAHPRDVDFASSLTLLQVTSWPGTGKWRDRNITKTQYAEHVYGRSHFSGPEKYKKCH